MVLPPVLRQGGLDEAAGMRESSIRSTSVEGLLVTWREGKPLEC